MYVNRLFIYNTKNTSLPITSEKVYSFCMLDNVVAIIAPFSCIVCSRKGYSLCPSCQESSLERVVSRCFRCHKSTLQHQVCTSCKQATSLDHVWVTSLYRGIAKDIVETLKFERARAVSADIAHMMSESMPILDPQTIVCHVPTTHTRIRQRGYDQSALIAKKLAHYKKLSYNSHLCCRAVSSRQVGAGRIDRFKQAEVAYAINPSYDIVGKHILVVDDITTSGATLQSIAKLLKKAGARHVDAAVFAQAM